MIFSQLKQIFSRPAYIITYIILVWILTVLWWKFTDFELILGNNGKTFLIIDTIFSFINILSFPLFIVAWIFRSYTLWKNSTNTAEMWFIGWFISIIISGSLCCGTSLLIPLGASFFSQFIAKYSLFNGLEIKLIGVIILLYGLYKLLTQLTTCQYIPKKSS